MKLYRTAHKSWRKIQIEEIEVERETEDSLWINGRRIAKKSRGDNYFQSYAEAKQWLMEKGMADVECCDLALETAQNILDEYHKL